MDGHRAQKPAPLIPPFDPSAGWLELSMVQEDFDEDEDGEQSSDHEDDEDDEDSEPGTAYTGIFTPTPTSGAFTATPLTSGTIASYKNSTSVVLPKLIMASVGGGSPLKFSALPRTASLSPQSAVTPSRMRSALLHRLSTSINSRAHVDSPYPVSDEDDDDSDGYMSDPGSAAALEYFPPVQSEGFARYAVQRGRQAPFPVRPVHA
jgi:hypothetical protein